VATAKTDALIRQVFALSDGVADALEIEWQRVLKAENLGWGDKLLLMESSIAQFQRTMPSFWQIHEQMATVKSLKSQGRFGDPTVLGQAEASLAKLQERLATS